MLSTRSGGNFSSETYNYFSEWRKSQQQGNLGYLRVGKIPSAGRMDGCMYVAVSEWVVSIDEVSGWLHIGTILPLPPSGCSPSTGWVHGCMLEWSCRCLRVGVLHLRGEWMVACWNDLVAASEWVFSIYEVSEWLHVMEGSIAMEGCIVKRIK